MPRHSRPVGCLLLTTVLAMGLSAALSGPAQADVTPSPSATAIAPASPSATAATPTPTGTPPRPDPTTTTPVSDAARRPVSARRGLTLRHQIQRIAALAEKYGDASTRRRVRDLADDDEPQAVAIANCAAPGGTTTGFAAYFDDSTVDDDAAFSWTVTGDQGVVDSGTATLDEGEGDFDLAGLALGTYTLAVTPAGAQQPSASSDFTVIGCVTTTVSCKAVTFTNPIDNPSVTLIYGRPSDGLFDIDGELIDLGPGEAAPTRTALPRIGWLALQLPESDDDLGFSLAGQVDSLAVPHDCDRPLSALSLSCVDDHPRLTVTFAREGSDQPVDFAVENAKGKIVAGRFLDDAQTTAAAKLPGPGRYTYRSYFEADKAYEKISVRVRSCGGSAAAGEGLADTGGPPFVPLPIGAALLAAAVIALTRRTRPARPAAPHHRRRGRAR